MPDDSNQGGFDSPLDELFVERARFHEPSAAERQAWAKAAKQASRRRRRRKRSANRHERLRRLVPLGVLAGVALLAYLLWPTGGRGGGGPDIEIVAPEQVRVVYATPSDVVADDGFALAIRNEMAVVDTWFKEQADGRAPKVLKEEDEVVVETRRFDATATELSDRADAVGLVADAFHDEEGKLPSDELLLVFVPLEFSAQVRCGESGLTIVVVWVGSCGDVPSIESTALDDGVSGTIAHELVHAMGAVASCAPHYGQNGHVVDDPQDIVYDMPAGGEPPAVNDLLLDPGHDDYYDHGNNDCPDIKDHPLWD